LLQRLKVELQTVLNLIIMKTTATHHESYQPKQGFGARLLFYAFLLSIIGLSKAFAQAPSAPTATAASNFTCTSFNANWGAVSGSTTYFLDISTDNSFSSFLISYSNLNVGNVTTYNVTGLTTGINYYYRVRSNDGTNTSLNSNTISVNTYEDPSFTYLSNTFCTSGNNPIAIISGLQGGLFSSSPSGLSINPSTGLIDLSISAVGVYVVTYTTNGGCSNSSSVTLTINNSSSNANFHYVGSPFNTNDPNPLPIFDSGASAGYFYVNDSSGLVINPNTGEIDLTNSLPGTYIVTNYISSGGTCADVMDIDTVVIAPLNGCNSFSTFQGNSYFYNPWYGCVGDSISFWGGICYYGLSAETSSVIINWGDGNIDSSSFVHSATDSCFNIFTHHVYNIPGVYTPIISFYSASACHNASLMGNVNVSNYACGNLVGTLFVDANNNCTMDGGELGIANALVTATQGGSVYYAWTDYLGYYTFYALASGTYTVEVAGLTSGYSITCSNSMPHAVTISTGVTTSNFAATCNGAFDAAITGISIWSALYPGQPEMILPHVGLLNAACNSTVVSGQVKIVLDACTQFTGASTYSGAGAPDAVITASTGDTLVWNVADINNIGNFSYFDYAIDIMMCTTAQVGDSACITMMILPTNGDADPTNNTYTRCFEIGVSYDPNNKEVMPTGVGAEGFIPADQPSLTYTLNFQNTGTALAWNIYLMDTIDTNIDINSIEILSASHRVQAYTLENRAVKFMFANIMLPDSTSNELESHGYVTFKAKLNAGLTPGTEIKNTGHIYFDYNEAVVTNTTLNTIEFPSSVKAIGKSTVVKVFPNPAKESVTVVSNSNNTGTITITDLLGKTVKEVTTTNEKTIINTADLQSGVYFIKLTQNNVSTTEKIMIAK
jgi:hypothetical protein